MQRQAHVCWGIADEWSLLETALTELPELDLVDQASLALGFVVQELDETRMSDPVMGRALVLMSLMGFRATRAAGLLIASGYSSEAVALARCLAELAARAKHVSEDETGQRAQAWFQGRGKKASGLVGQGYWNELSRSAHADVRHVRRLQRQGPDARLFMFASRFEDDWLISAAVAIGAKDLAVVGNLAGNLDDKALESLDRAIDRALDRRDSQLALW